MAQLPKDNRPVEELDSVVDEAFDAALLAVSADLGPPLRSASTVRMRRLIAYITRTLLSRSGRAGH